jgi:hypothetical protein
MIVQYEKYYTLYNIFLVNKYFCALINMGNRQPAPSPNIPEELHSAYLIYLQTRPSEFPAQSGYNSLVTGVNGAKVPAFVLFNRPDPLRPIGLQYLNDSNVLQANRGYFAMFVDYSNNVIPVIVQV